MELSQDQANLLIQKPKVFKEASDIVLWDNRRTREIISEDGHDLFLLDYYKSSIVSAKFSYNNRYNTSVVLFRYCSNAIHTNPQNAWWETFKWPHIHFYNETYWDKIASPVSDIWIEKGKENDIIYVLQKIIAYLHINNNPNIQAGMFNV